MNCHNFNISKYNFKKKIIMTLICGRTGSGKSFLIKDLIHQYKKQKAFDYIVVVTGTKHDDFEYINRDFVHNLSDIEEVVENLLRIGKIFMAKNRRFLLVLDDVAGGHFTTDTFKRLFNNYRHYNINMIIATQRIKQVPPDVRDNASLAFIYRQFSKLNKDAIEESFNLLDSKKDFFQFVSRACEQKYFMLVVDMIDLKYFKYKASEHPQLYINNKVKK